VVIYAGNHSPCNPLETVIRAAESLQRDRDILFCFIGGGSVFRAIERDIASRLTNVVCLPYVPREDLSAALSAADLHVITLGDAFRGLIHPSKLYNVLKVKAPVLYVGPEPSHVTDVARTTGLTVWRCSHGDVKRTVQLLDRPRCPHPTGAGAPSAGRCRSTPIRCCRDSSSSSPPREPRR
jgi:hypothetical protein